MKEDIIHDLQTLILKLEDLEFDSSEIYKVGVCKLFNLVSLGSGGLGKRQNNIGGIEKIGSIGISSSLGGTINLGDTARNSNTNTIFINNGSSNLLLAAESGTSDIKSVYSFWEISLGIEKEISEKIDSEGKSEKSFTIQVFIQDITESIKNEIETVLNTYNSLEHGLILYKNHRRIVVNNKFNQIMLLRRYFFPWIWCRKCTKKSTPAPLMTFKSFILPLLKN